MATANTKMKRGVTVVGRLSSSSGDCQTRLVAGLGVGHRLTTDAHSDCFILSPCFPSVCTVDVSIFVDCVLAHTHTHSSNRHPIRNPGKELSLLSVFLLVQICTEIIIAASCICLYCTCLSLCCYFVIKHVCVSYRLH